MGRIPRTSFLSTRDRKQRFCSTFSRVIWTKSLSEWLSSLLNRSSASRSPSEGAMFLHRSEMICKFDRIAQAKWRRQSNLSTIRDLTRFAPASGVQRVPWHGGHTTFVHRLPLPRATSLEASSFSALPTGACIAGTTVAYENQGKMGNKGKQTVLFNSI